MIKRMRTSVKAMIDDEDDNDDDDHDDDDDDDDCDYDDADDDGNGDDDNGDGGDGGGGGGGCGCFGGNTVIVPTIGMTLSGLIVNITDCLCRYLPQSIIS